MTGRFVDTVVIGGGENLTLNDLLLSEARPPMAPASRSLLVQVVENAIGVVVVSFEKGR